MSNVQRPECQGVDNIPRDVAAVCDVTRRRHAARLAVRGSDVALCSCRRRTVQLCTQPT